MFVVDLNVFVITNKAGCNASTAWRLDLYISKSRCRSSTELRALEKGLTYAFGKGKQTGLEGVGPTETQTKDDDVELRGQVDG